MERANRERAVVRIGFCAAALWITSLALSGCAGTQEGGDGPIVVGNVGEGNRGFEHDAEREERFRSRLEEARTAGDEGRFRDALAILEESLADHPPTRIRSDMVSLRRDLKQAMFGEGVVTARSRIEDTSHTLGDEIRIVIEVVNLGDTTLAIPVAHVTSSNRVVSGESRSTLVLRIVCEEWDRQGSTVSHERSIMVPLEDDIVLAPGASFEKHLSLETEDEFFRPELVVFRRVSVSGKLQPVEVSAGPDVWFEPIPISVSSTEVLPKGIDRVREDLEGTLERALELSRQTPQALNHVFFSGVLLFREDPELAGKYLVKALGADDPGIRTTALASLRLATGRADLRKADDWERWLQGL